MKQYLEALQTVLNEGQWQNNRTGIKCLSTVGITQRYDLAKGFPAMTTKKLAWKAVKGELLGFLRGTESAKEFRDLGCKIWDQNANENKEWLNNPFRKGEDDLGSIYGSQWRNWKAYKTVDYSTQTIQMATRLAEEGWVFKGQLTDPRYNLYQKNIDQIEYVIKEILFNPTNRRILFHGWNWAELDQMALPPCHLLYQFIPYVESKELNMTLTIRSNDMLLGNPFNIASAALLLSLVARLTGYTPRHLVVTSNDAHIYENHMDAVKEQLTREPRQLPKLVMGENVLTHEVLTQNLGFKDRCLTQAIMSLLNGLNPDDFTLVDYDPMPAISAPMAV